MSSSRGKQKQGTSYSDKRSEKIYSPRFKKRFLYLLTILYLRVLRPKETFEGSGENKRRTKRTKKKIEVYRVYLKFHLSSCLFTLTIYRSHYPRISSSSFTRFLGRRLETNWPALPHSTVVRANYLKLIGGQGLTTDSNFL